MKDIKSVMIGFLLATCMFLFMGQTAAGTLIKKPETGKYQGFADGLGNAYVIDTQTAELFWKNRLKSEEWTQNIPPYTLKKNDK